MSQILTQKDMAMVVRNALMKECNSLTNAAKDKQTELNRIKAELTYLKGLLKKQARLKKRRLKKK